ncbi:hypothetical protein RhiJN_21906 [Ceratobasidium sp. AG-Ba]|nr:hypothetical protein RhiJN_21906 [Ceratobasidium sp. AG-Ba]
MSLFAPHDENPMSGDYLQLKNRNVTIAQGAKIVQPLDQLVDDLMPVVPGKPFIDALKEDSSFRVMSILPEHLNKEPATLNAYHGLNSLSTAKEIHEALAKSWDESPPLTLRIIWNMRSIHEGHGDKISFYRAFGWLYKHHPRTAIKNLKFLVEGTCPRTIIHKLKIEPKQKRNSHQGPRSSTETKASTDRQTEEITTKLPHGCFKDLLNILTLAMRGELMDSKLKEYPSLNVPPQQPQKRLRSEFEAIKKAKSAQNERFGLKKAIEIRKAKSYEKDAARARDAKAQRQSKHKADFDTLQNKLNNDNRFLALYATVAHIFADHLAKDAELLKKIESAAEEEAFMLKFQLSNSSKWAPTLECFHDRSTNIATAIALVLYSRGLMPELSVGTPSQIDQSGAHTIRSYYRRWFLSPLRRFIDVTEVKMSDGKWSHIDYDQVSSKCLLANKSSFWLHDSGRMQVHFASYIKDRGTTLKPHELLAEAMKLDFETNAQVAELPVPQYKYPDPPFYYFQTPLGRLKFKTLAEAEELARKLGGRINRSKRTIEFDPVIASRLSAMLSQADTGSTTILAPSRDPIGGVAISAIPITSTALPEVKAQHGLAATLGQKCSIIKERGGIKYLKIGDVLFEIKPPIPIPPAHEVLAKEVNNRHVTTSASHEKQLLPMYQETEAKRKALMDKHSTMKLLIEGQWDAIVEQLGGPGSLQSTLAIVDFNRSMGFPLDTDWYKSRPKKRNPVLPMLPAMALGTLLSRLSTIPFQDIVLVSRKDPQLLELPEHGVFQAAKYIAELGLKSESSIESVFLKLLLPTAINNKTKPGDMVKRYFIFSDLEFESSVAKETHARIGRAFRRAGYKVPEIIYWNLQGNRPLPAHEDTNGCGVVTGFSGTPLKMFVDDQPPNFYEPYEVMRIALEKSCYDELKVFDMPTSSPYQVRPSSPKRGGGYFRSGRGSGRGRGATYGW